MKTKITVTIRRKKYSDAELLNFLNSLPGVVLFVNKPLKKKVRNVRQALTQAIERANKKAKNET